MKDTVTVELSRDEALVLFEYLSRWCDLESLEIEHESEGIAMLALSRELDKALREPFLPNYAELLARARHSLASSK
jgi:hypothetical protein